MSDTSDNSPLSQDDWAACLRVLQRVSEDVSLAVDDERFKALVAKINRNGKKSERQTAEEKRRAGDAARRAQTGMVQIQQAQQNVRKLPAGVVYPVLSPSPLPVLTGQDYEAYVPPLLPEEFPEILNDAVRCYICKTMYKPLHFFYHLLCPDCARENYARRNQRADLRGRIALLTGGRIKIGYQTALRMLRDGATVLITTRFPRDAARRFAEETDFAEWKHRLRLYAIDLRRPTDVEAFADHLIATLPHLDILINNAAQTVKRPLTFYRHLLPGETEAVNTLPESVRSLVPSATPYQSSPLLEAEPNYRHDTDAAALEMYFPSQAFDGDGQQIDARPSHSWRLRLEEVSTLEMVEVQLVNAVAPFILNSRLKPLFLRSANQRRFIVNVSAMEGQFARETKTEFHPHTNMAKAALNMMTRTSAQDYARHGIYMTSVDTGWVTDENPLPKRDYLRDTNGFYPPLDIIDGMARVYDPIVQGIKRNRELLYGVFLKDYKEYPW